MKEPRGTPGHKPGQAESWTGPWNPQSTSGVNQIPPLIRLTTMKTSPFSLSSPLFLPPSPGHSINPRIDEYGFYTFRNLKPPQNREAPRKIRRSGRPKESNMAQAHILRTRAIRTEQLMDRATNLSFHLGSNN